MKKIKISCSIIFFCFCLYVVGLTAYYNNKQQKIIKEQESKIDSLTIPANNYKLLYQLSE